MYVNHWDYWMVKTCRKKVDLEKAERNAFNSWLQQVLWGNRDTENDLKQFYKKKLFQQDIWNSL